MNDEQERLRELIAQYLAEGKLLHLATLVNEQPWLCHVWYATGLNDESLVFTSNRTRRHSHELSMNPRVSGGVVAIELEGLGQHVRGLSFEGHCHEAVGPRIEVAYNCYATRWPAVRGMFSARDVETGATNMRLYVVNMTRVVLFDEVNYPGSPRQEITLVE